jgi:hypothetical protein
VEEWVLPYGTYDDPRAIFGLGARLAMVSGEGKFIWQKSDAQCIAT